MIYRFASFEVDDSEFRLSQDGVPVVLEPKALRLLLFLVANPGRLIRKQELLDSVWFDAAVTENALTRSIALLRKTLNDDSREPKFIETVPTVGFRFIAPVATPSLAGVSVDAEATPSPLAETIRPPSKARTVSFIVLAGVALLAFAGWMLQRQFSRTKPIRSLAVLPLANLSGDASQDYFADGTTDELITELATLPNLRVVSRTSAMLEKGNHKTLREIAAELNVDAVVEGSVVRSGDRVRITAQLIDARDDRHLWAQSFEGPSKDIVALQDRVATDIAVQARVVMAPGAERSNATRSVNPAAYDAYLRGRYFYAKSDILRSAEYFQQAIDADPSYASAYAGLADDLEAETVFGMAPIKDAMPKALAAANHAIALDPENGEAYEALGSIETIYGWSWEAAERDLQRSVALSPSYSVVEMKYATYLDAVGRPQDAVQHIRRAVSLDPLSFYMVRRLGTTLFLARDYDGALEELGRAAEMEPREHGILDNWISHAYEQKGMHDEAVEHDLLALESRRPELPVSQLRLVYKSRGWIAYWSARTDMMRSNAKLGCDVYDLGRSYVRLGDRDNAFASFNQVVDDRCFDVVSFKTDPVLDPIRGDKRFQSLLQRVNLAEK
jgi:TolB-like protein/DNA-binding winged helix-turn-helix (wHTH) protein/tetratricopeptide (TPR) repeat protein